MSKNSYGDGNVYRGQRSKDSAVKTITWERSIETFSDEQLPRMHTSTTTHTAQPQRTWVGLTDEEIETNWQRMWGNASSTVERRRRFVRAIEAKLKEKNT